jgi:hypothetical protein
VTSVLKGIGWACVNVCLKKYKKKSALHRVLSAAKQRIVGCSVSLILRANDANWTAERDKNNKKGGISGWHFRRRVNKVPLIPIRLSVCSISHFSFLASCSSPEEGFASMQTT